MAMRPYDQCVVKAIQFGINLVYFGSLKKTSSL